jgi:CRP/FNR family transcriptional regulator, cyclic AMP receptor protein
LAAFAGIPFFEDLSPEKAEAYGRQCARRRYQESELVLDFEDDSTDVYFVVHGELRILVRSAAGREMIFDEVGPGRFFGEMAAIDGLSRSANVTALTKAELCVVPAAVFLDIVLSEPKICRRLMRLLTMRIRELDARLFEHSVLDLRHRLYAELLRLAAPRQGASDQAILSPPPRQQDLAARIGCRREQVSRELSIMIDEGLAEKTKGGLVLLRPATIESRVKEMLDRAE